MGTLGAPKEAGNLPLGGGGKPGTEPREAGFLLPNKKSSGFTSISN
jgi:hypothetical protein